MDRNKEKKKQTTKVKAAPKKRGRKPKSLRKPIKGGKGKEKVKWNDFILEKIKDVRPYFDEYINQLLQDD